MHPDRTTLLSATLAAALAHAALAQTQIVSMLCNVPGNPTNHVPGLAGVEFFPGAFADVFRNPIASSSQSYWVMTARANIGPSGSRVVILGGQSVASQVIAIQGQPTPFLPGRDWGDFDAQVDVNENGSAVLVSNLTGSTADDQVVARFNLNLHAFDLPYREGQPVPGLSGVNFGPFLSSPSITDNEQVSAMAQIVGSGVTSANNVVLEFNNNILLRKGISHPAGAPTPWSGFTDMTFQMPLAGLFVVQGTDGATAPSNQLAAISNNPVLRVGGTIPGLTSPIAANHIDRIRLASCGDWIARGQNQNQTEDWVVVNGDIFNRRGVDITPLNPSGERFSDARFQATFFTVAINASSHKVVGGYTDNPDPNHDEVLVLDNVRVIAREGDPIDLNANGLYDDNAFIGGFVPDAAFIESMGASLVVYTLVPIKNSMGQIIGYSYVCISPSMSCAADFNNDGVVDFFDYDEFVNCFEGVFCPPWTTADFNNDGVVDFFDYDEFVLAFETPCP